MAFVWERAAELIIEGCGWGDDVRPGPGAISGQMRLIRDGERRWLGITGSPYHGAVVLYGGVIAADGSYGAPLANSGDGGVYGLDGPALVTATRALWQRLDDLDPSGDR
ncbi:hypothetical protein [Streptomyces niveus]|uniref:hypothetical protein n=1 Tax=Streptomyces niveus TaxID=193462 RepID=UPI0034267500